jgi:hypothetical protein
VACITFGLLPAVHLSRTNQLQAMSARGSNASRGASRLRASLVVGQLVLATLLLVGAGLLSHSFIRLSTFNKGYDPNHVLAFNLLFPDQYSSARKAGTIETLLTRFRINPGVRSAGFARHGLLIGEELYIGRWVPPGRTLDEMRDARIRVRSVSDGFLTAMGVPVIEGRDLTWDDFETIFTINTKGNYPEKYKPEKERSLHRELMENMRDKNWIRVTILRFDEQAVAFDYGFTVNGRLEDWRTGFDLSYADWGSGTLLLYFQLKYMFTEKYQDLDFLRGEYNYKDKWVPARREFVELRIIPSHKLSARLALIWLPNIWQWIKSKRKQNPDKE